jgi:hypothetical protein
VKNNHLYFASLIITSGLLWGFIQDAAHVSGTPYTWSFLVRETLIYMGCCLTAYLISFLWFKYFGFKYLTRGFNFFDIYIAVNTLEINILLVISTAVIGSLFHTIYFGIQIINAYSYLPEDSNISLGIHLELLFTIFFIRSLFFSFNGLVFMLFGWLSKRLIGQI